MYDLNQIISTAQTNLAKPTENQLAKAKYYGYTDEQVNQEMNKLQPNTAPQPVATPQITPATPQPATPPTQPAAVAPQPEVKPTGVTTPQAQVESDILLPSVTGINPNQAKLEQNNLNKFNSNLSVYSTGKALFDGVQGGTILPGTKEFTDLTTRNPQVLADYNLIKAEKAKNDTVKVLGNAIIGEQVQTKPSNALEQLVSFFTKSMDTDVASEYQNSVINNPAYQASIQTLNGINQQIADNNKNINALRDDVRKKYSAGTPESLIASAIAREARPLIEQGQYLTQLQENAQSEMTRLFEENKQVFDLKQEEITNNRNIALQLYGTIRAEEIRQEDIMRADEELQMKMEQARTEQEYLQYKDERDYNLKVAEAMQKSGQWESEFDLKAAEFGLKQDEFKLTAEKASKGNWSVKDGLLVNADTGETKPLSSAVSMQGLQPNLVNNFLDQCRIEGQCGEGANDYLQKLGSPRLIGNSYTSKTEDINSSSPVVGSVAVWNPQGDSIGHAGIVLENRGDKLLIRDWNYGLDEKQQVHEVPISAITKSGGGYIVPDKLKEMQIPEMQRTVLKGIEEIKNHPGLDAAVGFGWQKLLPGNQGEEGFLPASAAEDFRVKFMSFRDNIVLPNLELLKGAMSDNDIKFIRSAGTAASLGMSEKAFRAELDRIANNIYEKFGLEKRVYAPKEEALINELVKAGATDAEIDEALNKFRS